jgi:hypothetical protein
MIREPEIEPLADDDLIAALEARLAALDRLPTEAAKVWRYLMRLWLTDDPALAGKLVTVPVLH